MARAARSTVDMTSICKEYGLTKRAYKDGFRYLVRGTTPEGRTVFVTVPLEKKDGLSAVLHKIKAAKAELEQKLRPQLDTAELIEAFIRHRGLSEGSVDTVRRVLKRYAVQGADAANRAQVDRILSSDLAPGTKRLYLHYTHSFFRWLSESGTLPGAVDPAKGVQMHFQSAHRTRIPTDDEIAKLRRWAELREKRHAGAKLYLELLITTGARVSTIAALHCGDLKDGLLSLYNVKIKKAYDVQLPVKDTNLLKLWAEHTAGRKDTDALFEGEEARWHHECLRAAMARWGRDASGEYVSPHSFRHRVATRMLQAGVPLDVVSKVLDHSSVAITLSVYAKHSQEQINAAFDALG